VSPTGAASKYEDGRWKTLELMEAAEEGNARELNVTL
jgi:hypothetical protein